MSWGRVIVVGGGISGLVTAHTLGGLVPPLKITPTDHEGGGVVQIFTVKGGKFVKATDWFSAYNDVVAKHIKEAGKK